MGDQIVNEGSRWAFLLAWLAANLITWLVTFFKFANRDEYHYTLYLMKYSLPVARGSAACINLNSMLIVLLVCRNLISFLRGSCETNRCYRRSIRRQFDKNITFHKLLAYTIAFFMVLHITSHCFNFQHLCTAAEVSRDEDPLGSKLSNLPRTKNSWLNPIEQFSQAPYGLGIVSNMLGM